MLNAGLGALVLLLSMFLVVNTISALLSQQTRQIGVMKAVGADMGQVTGLYLVLILIFSLLALAVAIPLAAVSSYAVCQFIAGMINVDLAGFRITPLALGLQLAIGLVIPLLASLGPVIGGARMTVREAISSYGVAALGKRTWFDRLLETVRGLPRPLLLSLRNTFRRKGRLALTLSTLVLGGAIFIAVLNVHQAMYDALDITFGYILSDVNVDFGRGYRVERIQEALKTIPGISGFEGWGFSTGQSMQADGISGDQVVLVAPPAASTLIKPNLIDGRWLLPEDDAAIVVGNHYMRLRPETKVGDTLPVRMQGKDHPFVVVGIYKMAGNTTTPILYTNYEYLADLLNQNGQIYSIRVSLEDNSTANQKTVAEQMQARFKALGMPVGGIQTGGDIIQQNRFIVDILIYMLLMMAVLIAVVGGLGLMGTMSMNVLERTREIGVMRSIGAVDAAIMQMVVTEGMIIGMISWGLGALLAIPITNVLNVLVGVSILTVPLDYVFALKGLLLWLGVVIFLSAAASLMPARNAVRLTVRDVLAYE
jgi:putative ABC transport system permease protein